ncbi:MAG TPA: leucine-rich repeat domain-containing protein [Flavobacterium sp.]|nr:leucine-rich repeat domain-containing protein [Flavobacterium sp.]
MKLLFRYIALAMIMIFSNASAQGNDRQKKMKFATLDEALKNPEKVVRLKLNSKIEVDAISDWSKFYNLEYLTLENDGLPEIPASISHLKKLKILNLSGNNFSTLPKNFNKLANLEEIYLNNEKKMDLPKTLEVLGSLPNLKKLHLEDDNLTYMPKEIAGLKHLESLFLNNNKLKGIPKQLEALDHLQYLEIQENNFKPDIEEVQNLNFGFKIKL